MCCQAQQHSEMTLRSTRTMAEDDDKHKNNANEAANHKNDAK